MKDGNESTVPYRLAKVYPPSFLNIYTIVNIENVLELTRA